jgi:hypothetical protein
MKAIPMRDLFDDETCKVLLMAVTPFVVWGAQIELAIKIISSLGAAIYIWTKIVCLIRDRRNRPTPPEQHE